jgi:hypothetical protein
MTYPKIPVLDPGIRVTLHINGFWIVGIVGFAHDWAAYCERDTWTEEQVADNGDKIDETLADQLLPMFKRAGLTYRH